MSDAAAKLLIMTVLAGLAKSFLLTEAIELTLALLLGVGDRKGMLLVFLANLMTNPAAVLIFFAVSFTAGSKAAAFAAIPIEIAVLISEWRLYFSRPDMLDIGRLIFARAAGQPGRETATLILSLILNIASYGLGALISAL